MNPKIHCILPALMGLLTLSGCVTGRRNITVAVPTTAAAPATATKGPVYIHSVTDNRKFENKPSEPSTPSVEGDVNDLTPAAKDRMIGRQRNTYGHGMGDVALANNGTVTGLTRQLIEEGLRRNGYAISNDPNAPITLDASVDKFWTWMTPGFVALTFEVRMATTLTFKQGDDSIEETVTGYGESHGQIAKDGNWEQTFAPAFANYLEDFADKISKQETYFNLPSKPRKTD